MRPKLRVFLQSTALAIAAAVAGVSGAQAQSEKDIHLDAATRNTGGDKFLKDWTRDRYCMYVDNPALLAEIRTHTAPVAPMQIFDDVWYVGFENVGQFVVKNAGGYVLIDALNRATDIDNYTIPTLQSLGLYPQASLLGVFLTHGHFDHDGGAPRLRDIYGSGFPIYLGSGDAGGKTYSPTLLDSANLGYQQLSLGGRPMTVISSPGHTPGTTSSFIPVRENGKEHLLLIVGGTAIPTTVAASRSYVASVERMYAAAKDLGAVGTLHPHPIIDGGNQHMADIAARGSRTPNPYILGKEKLLRTVAIMRECGAAQVGQVDATAKTPVWRVTSVAFDAQSPSPSRLAARVQSDWGPVVGQEVKFSVGTSGAACVAVTDSTGLATCASLPTLRARDEVTASYAGSSSADFVNLPGSRTALVASLACDIDGNGSVDRNDIGAIVAAIGKPVAAGDARDADGDGRTSISDARMCTLRCTKEQCAP
ncbi:MBL fold metallo-hydrolase [Piscinibacter koreensis]|uniref:MBL fold metallo-hydrolase n=1 Tax=Piscinibacter koreensis TaxID=2742824 RepID=A0A7Y6NNN3_9BURK|nr:MBL fold metallo-hydrolase [Schlegelella koreensis]NUZ06537.1 MBL fold metallo-hydrolase [Schlegelella koreensis]